MEGLTEPIFLSFMCRLRVLEIYGDIDLSSPTTWDFNILSLLIRPLRISLTPPATLAHLKFDIEFTGNDFYFDLDGLFNSLHDAGFWSHLDPIITHPTGSRLQRVDINTEYNFYHDEYIMEPYNTDVSKPVLDALPLLHEKGILFVNATECWVGLDRRCSISQPHGHGVDGQLERREPNRWLKLWNIALLQNITGLFS